jgi:hypothetical protein
MIPVVRAFSIRNKLGCHQFLCFQIPSFVFFIYRKQPNGIAGP